jgi:hypothetical protein
VNCDGFVETIDKLPGTRSVMPRTAAALLAGISLFAAVASASGRASTITFGPGANPAVAVSAVPAPLAAGGEAGTGYLGFGVDFSTGGREGVFCDEYLGWSCTVQAFGGVNRSGDLDLLTGVDGRIVVPGTLAQGLTSQIYAEAGYAAAGALLLTVYDIDGNDIGHVLNGNPTGPHGRTTFSIIAPGATIASFAISSPGADGFGVDVIALATPIGIPEPGSLALIGAGVLGLGLIRRRRNQGPTAS